MNDSARLIRVVYRFNPNEGLYDAIGRTTEPPVEAVEAVDALEALDALRMANAVAPYKVSVSLSPPTKPLEVQETLATSDKQCAGCFQSLTRGTFLDCSKNRLFFCEKCSLQPAKFNYQQAITLVIATHLFWGLALVLR